LLLRISYREERCEEGIWLEGHRYILPGGGQGWSIKEEKEKEI
jgi:hypothetical protein